MLAHLPLIIYHHQDDQKLLALERSTFTPEGDLKSWVLFDFGHRWVPEISVAENRSERKHSNNKDPAKKGWNRKYRGRRYSKQDKQTLIEKKSWWKVWSRMNAVSSVQSDARGGFWFHDVLANVDESLIDQGTKRRKNAKGASWCQLADVSVILFSLCWTLLFSWIQHFRQYRSLMSLSVLTIALTRF